MIASVSLLIPLHLRAREITRSGWSLAMSFILLATLLLTHSDGSLFRFSRIGNKGEGSFFNPGIAMAQGNLGRLPSLASRRAFSSLSLKSSVNIWDVNLCLLNEGITDE